MEEIIEKIPSEIIIEIKRRQKVSYSKKFHQIKQRNLKKIRYLENISKNKLVVQKKWFKNLTQTEIPPKVKKFFRWG